MFMAYKYTGSQYGMMIAFNYSGAIRQLMYVVNGTKTAKTITVS